MTVIYQDNFDGDTLGQLPSGWANIAGTWAVLTRNAISGQAFGSVNATNGDTVLYTGVPSRADSVISYQTKRSANNYGVILRSNVDFTNAYVLNFQLDGSNNTDLAVNTGSGFTIAQSGSPINAGGSNGDVVGIEVALAGSTFQVRVWNITAGQSRPSNPTVTLTDGALSTPGYTGFFIPFASGSGSAAPSVDSYSINDGAAPTGLTIARDNAAIRWAPYVWSDDGTSRNANTTNAYCEFNFTGTSLVLNTTALASSAVYPMVRAVIDDVTVIDITLATATSYTVATGLASGTHKVRFLTRSMPTSNSAPSYWSAGFNARITGFVIDAGATVSATTAQPKSAIVFGDSITKGVAVLGAGDGPATTDGTRSMPALLMGTLDVEFGQIGYDGQGFTVGNGEGVPALSTGYQYYFSGSASRLVGGLLSPAPDYLICIHGTNPPTGSVPTQSDVQAQIATFRTIAPSAKILMVVPIGGYARSTITAAVAAVQNAGDLNIALIDADPAIGIGLTQSGSNGKTFDGIHPNEHTAAKWAAIIASKVQHAVEPRRFTITVS